MRGHPFQSQLHEVAASLAISPLSTRTGCRTPDETGILDAMIQPIFDYYLVEFAAITPVMYTEYGALASPDPATNNGVGS